MHPNSQNTKSLMRGVAAPFTENGSEQSFCTALLFHFSRTLLAAADHSLQRECSNSPIVGNLKFTRNFPSEERFGLTNQMRRAAVSISSNIAEGSSRSSHSDYARFVEIATGSVFEIVSQAFIAHRQSFLSEDQFRKSYTDAEELSRMLSGLRK